jgi:uncharacterized OsmC-like protein
MIEQEDTIRNGVDVGALASVCERYREEPATSTRILRTRSAWRGGFTMEVDMGREGKLVIDEPPALGGEGRGPRPTSVCLSALAACISMGYVLWACLDGRTLEFLEVSVEAEIDGAPFLRVRDGMAGFRAIRVTPNVLLSNGETLDDAVHEQILASSPMASSLTACRLVLAHKTSA